MAVSYDIELEKSSDYAVAVTWKSDGQIVVLSDWDARLVAKEYPDSPDILIDLGVGSGIEIDGPAGTVTVTFSGASLLGATWRQIEYDLIVWRGPANAPIAMKKLVEGTISFDPSMSEPG